jgi:hypothetical protein
VAVNGEVPQVNSEVPREPDTVAAGAAPDQEAPSAADDDTGARTPYFMPRRLGATAPHDCSNWSLDYRDDHEQANVADNDQPIRRLEDESLVPQLNLLLDAGRRVAL